MRLGQLARKLAISPTEIIEFLATRNIHLESGANTKLDEPLVLDMTRQFAPHLVKEILGSPAADGDPIEVETTVDGVVNVEERPSVREPEGPPIENPLDEVIEREKTEVIKAPKVELQGLKVVGKIDLPEPKTKAPAETGGSPGEGMTIEKDRTPVNRKTSFQKPDRSEQWKKQKARQQQEEDRNEKKRKIEAERIKEQRTQNYLKKVKSVPTKAARRMEEQVVEMTEDVPELPKTLWGKFVHWLTT